MTPVADVRSLVPTSAPASGTVPMVVAVIYHIQTVKIKFVMVLVTECKSKAQKGAASVKLLTKKKCQVVKASATS